MSLLLLLQQLFYFVLLIVRDDLLSDLPLIVLLEHFGLLLLFDLSLELVDLFYLVQSLFLSFNFLTLFSLAKLHIAHQLLVVYLALFVQELPFFLIFFLSNLLKKFLFILSLLSVFSFNLLFPFLELSIEHLFYFVFFRLLLLFFMTFIFLKLLLLVFNDLIPFVIREISR